MKMRSVLKRSVLQLSLGALLSLGAAASGQDVAPVADESQASSEVADSQSSVSDSLVVEGDVAEPQVPETAPESAEVAPVADGVVADGVVGDIYSAPITGDVMGGVVYSPAVSGCGCGSVYQPVLAQPVLAQPIYAQPMVVNGCGCVGSVSQVAYNQPFYQDSVMQAPIEGAIVQPAIEPASAPAVSQSPMVVNPAMPAPNVGSGCSSCGQTEMIYGATSPMLSGAVTPMIDYGTTYSSGCNNCGTLRSGRLRGVIFRGR